MRVLFVAPYIPSLIRPRALNFIKQLSRMHEITLVALRTGDKCELDAIEQLNALCEKVHAVTLNKKRALLSCCQRLLTPMPMQAAYTCMSDLNSFIYQMTVVSSFDVLHVEHIRGAHLTEQINHLPRVYDSVDCITRLLKQKLNEEKGVMKKALGIEELIKMRSYEPRVANSFDSIIITSERDKRVLEYLIRRVGKRPAYNGQDIDNKDILFDNRLLNSSINDPQINVVRNGVDSEYFHPMPSLTQSNTIAFSGKMSYFPNSSAVLRFYSDVFPLIKQKRPDAKFKIIGSDPPKCVSDLAADPSVEVTGYVPDIRLHLATAGVVVCPLTVGVGIQNKVLEAMAMEKPVVASSIAFNGIPGAIKGRDLLMADDPADMANTVLSVLNSPEYGIEIGKNACRFVRDNYSWEASARALSSIYAEAVDSRKDTAPLAA